jgi:Amt family ammonium transporter
MLPHDLSVATVGGFILWFGWYGFNPGSTLSAMDFEGIGRVAANTTLAACSAGLVAMFYAFPKTKTWDVSFTVNGFLAGLVAVTCPCYWVSPTGAILLGGWRASSWSSAWTCSSTCASTIRSVPVPVHGLCGIWGTISLGLFASGQFGATGHSARTTRRRSPACFYGGGMTVLMRAGSSAARSSPAPRSRLDGDDARDQRRRAAACVAGRRAAGSRSARARHSGLPEYALHSAATPQGGATVRSRRIPGLCRRIGRARAANVIHEVEVVG